ncbi:MAG: hypothetical protein A2297_02785 [Elusimicrobia bacterium RIFOXYB2_FULL_48_7]|nr:MAG: hypothetical protein A2297_02785 [Elusimicrobia bacterium RIFOXYB2_FULL_48_7]
MCFSAGASFTAGVLLTFVGTETLRKIRRPAQIAFAGIPVFFAFQQFMEGILWLTIGNPAHHALETVSTHVFLIMAQSVWPILIPLSVLLIEKNKTRKRILYGLLAAGIGVGLYYFYRLLLNGIHAKIVGMHIVYEDTAFSYLGAVTISVYLAATIAPLFVSSTKRVYILGIIMGLSFIASAIFYLKCLTSVWCFFAAVISFVIFYIFRDAHLRKISF